MLSVIKSFAPLAGVKGRTDLSGLLFILGVCFPASHFYVLIGCDTRGHGNSDDHCVFRTNVYVQCLRRRQASEMVSIKQMSKLWEFYLYAEIYFRRITYVLLAI